MIRSIKPYLVCSQRLRRLGIEHLPNHSISSKPKPRSGYYFSCDWQRNLNIELLVDCDCTMEPEHKRILKENSKEFTYSISFEKIKPLLLQYKMFNRYMWEDIQSVSDVLDLLPSRGPHAFQNFIGILRNANYQKEADSLEDNYSPVLNIPSRFIYKMSSKPLGYCLIINNVSFEVKMLEKRLGSDVDCKSLKEFFIDIGYEVFVKPNLRTAEMYNCLETFSKSDFKNVDSAIVIILSHGGLFDNEDGIYGIDGQYILKKHIVEFFSNSNCPQLQGKPKVFFFMACRGDNKDYGVPKVFPPESPDAANITLKTIPSFTDILIIHSTLPYNISIRDHKKGSWFCQDLISVLKNNHSKYDLETMIKMVNKQLTQRISLEYRVTQAAHVESMAFDSLMLYRIQDA